MSRPKDPNKMKNYLSLRLSKELNDFIDDISSCLGITKAEYVRMMIQANYTSYQKRVVENEDAQGNIDDFL